MYNTLIQLIQLICKNYVYYNIMIILGDFNFNFKNDFQKKNKKTKKQSNQS